MKKKSEHRKFRFYSLIFILLVIFCWSIVGIWWKQQTVAAIIMTLLCLFYPLFMLIRFWNKIGNNFLVMRWISILALGIIAGIFSLTELFP